MTPYMTNNFNKYFLHLYLIST